MQNLNHNRLCPFAGTPGDPQETFFIFQMPYGARLWYNSRKAAIIHLMCRAIRGLQNPPARMHNDTTAHAVLVVS